MTTVPTPVPGGRNPTTGWSQDTASGYQPPAGVAAHSHSPADVVGAISAAGFFIRSASGSRWLVTVSDAGALVVTAA